MAAVTAAIITGAVVAGAAGAAMSASAANSERKAQKSAAEDAANRARVIKEESKKAQIDAIEQGKVESQKRLASITQTIFTTPLGLTSSPNIKKTTLGSTQ